MKNFLVIVIISFIILFVAMQPTMIAKKTSKFTFDAEREELLNLYKVDGIHLKLSQIFDEVSVGEDGIWLIYNEGNDIGVGNGEQCKGIIYDHLNNRKLFICSNNDEVDVLYLLNELSLYIKQKDAYNLIEPTYFSDEVNRFNVVIMQFYSNTNELIARSETVLSAHLEEKALNYETNLADKWLLSQSSKLEMYGDNIESFDISITPEKESYNLLSYSPIGDKITGKIIIDLVSETSLSELDFNLEKYIFSNHSDMRTDKLGGTLSKKIMRHDNVAKFNSGALLLTEQSELKCHYTASIVGLNIGDYEASFQIDL